MQVSCISFNTNGLDLYIADCKTVHSTTVLYSSKATVDRVSVPSPIAIDILKDAKARDRVHMYLFSV